MPQVDELLREYKRMVRERFVSERNTHWCNRCRRLIEGCIHCHKAQCKIMVNDD